jgi:hypothetical protein
MRRHERVLRLATLAVVLATMGCMTGMQKIDWDLRQGHAKSAVQWTDASSAREVANVEATIKLPGERTFQGRDVTLRLFGQGDQIQVLAILFPKATLDDGYKQARDLSRQWHLNTTSLDSWYQEVQDGRKRGVRDANVRFYAAMSGQPLSSAGPTPSANVLDSYDEQKPFLLDFELQWASG